MAEGIADLTPNRDDKPAAEAPQQPQAASQPIPYELHKKEGRHWPVLLVYFLLALIVATGVVFAGRWAYHKVSNTEPSKSTPTQIKKTPEPAAASKESAGQSTGSPSSNGSTPTPAPTPNPSNSSTSLPKTGDD